VPTTRARYNLNSRPIRGTFFLSLFGILFP
jgi:hypothetical protein